MKKICISLSSFLFVASMAPAATIIYSATLNGLNESPVNNSPGTGTARITVDDVLRTIAFDIAFSGLTGTTTLAHIHAATAVAGAGTAGVATQGTLVGFPLGVQSGTFNNTLDMNLSPSWNASYVTAHGGNTTQAFTDLNQAIIDGKAYFNIHTSAFGGGEIRGFLTPAPEPTAIALLGLGSVALGFVRRRRQ